MSKAQLVITQPDELDTKVNKKAQASYKKMCRKKKLVYKPLIDAPKIFRNIDIGGEK